MEDKTNKIITHSLTDKVKISEELFADWGVWREFMDHIQEAMERDLYGCEATDDSDGGELTYQDLIDLRQKLRAQRPILGIIVSDQQRFINEWGAKLSNISQHPIMPYTGPVVYEDPEMSEQDLHLYYDRGSLLARLKRIKGQEGQDG